jgi:soluble lytic murein transglycosylase
MGFLQSEAMLRGWNKFQVAMVVSAVLALSGTVGAIAQTENASSAAAAKKHPTKGKSTSATKTTGKSSASKSKSAASGAGTKKGAKSKRHVVSKPTARSIKLTSAFHASEQLRPMAQQLAMTRSAAAYSGVESYARQHPGEGAATAYLALGHAYMLDRRYSDAVGMYRQAGVSGQALDDYADYLGAQAALQAGRGADAYALLDHFEERHPDSIFVANAPILLANAYIQQNNPQGALKVLQPLSDSAQASHGDFRYALGRAYQMAGDVGHAAPVYRSLYAELPLSFEAGQARGQLQAMGVPLTAEERKAHADQLFNAKRFAEAGEEYHSIERDGLGLSAADHDALLIYAAVCDMKMKRISRCGEATGDVR